ncbi:hypothetical protein Ga0100231_007865 [Opitutaceae bacterium TAV4]|uniref:hypothetical protein n=1 Tax=Geminisphaera colitermitum TaxID=1148786 RepID=UPI000158DA2B|nr:hypothetical protein [Geminisphaera colitermitum]RRJ94288.1 hypothetical protein Ga0100231_007865 [Opitutaceae bacterium TAV4]RRJ98379.1 hypothetical protein Ga0100230_008135 [Opitutaceae bacterium TAV3]
MTKSRLLGTVVFILVLLAIFLALPWLSPVRGVERAWGKLIDGVADNDFKDVTSVVALDYKDGWGLTRDEVIVLAQTVRRHFIVCSIDRHPHKVELSEDRHTATVRSVIRVNGSGSPVAQAIIQVSGQTQAETTFEWRRGSWKPWDWKLTSVANPEADQGVKMLQAEAAKAPQGIEL